MSTTHKTLAAALVAAQRDAVAVEKDKTNTHMKFAYASAEGIIAEASEALGKHGLAVVATKWVVVPSEIANVTSKVVVDYVLVHDSSDTTMSFQTETSVLPGPGRPQDKAEFGAITGALGYFLRSLLLLAREDADNSIDARDDRHVVAPPKQPPATPADNAKFDAAIAALRGASTMEELEAAKKTASPYKANPTIVDAYKQSFTRLKSAQ